MVRSLKRWVKLVLFVWHRSSKNRNQNYPWTQNQQREGTKKTKTKDARIKPKNITFTAFIRLNVCNCLKRIYVVYKNCVIH